MSATPLPEDEAVRAIQQRERSMLSLAEQADAAEMALRAMARQCGTSAPNCARGASDEQRERLRALVLTVGEWVGQLARELGPVWRPRRRRA